MIAQSEANALALKASRFTNHHETDGFNWNDAFQKLFCVREPSPEGLTTKGLHVASFMGKFKAAAEATVITIVEELPLPPGLKTIKLCKDSTHDALLPIPFSLNSDLHYVDNGLHFHVFDFHADTDQDQTYCQSTLVHKILGHEIVQPKLS